MSRTAPSLTLLGAAACAGDPTPAPLPEVVPIASRADGAWTWSLHGLACPSHTGMPSPTDGSEGFDVTQRGDRLRASFRDRAGNGVTLECTMRNGEKTHGTRMGTRARERDRASPQRHVSVAALGTGTRRSGPSG